MFGDIMMIEYLSIVMILKLGLYIMMKKDKKFGDIIIMLYFDLFIFFLFVLFVYENV